MATNRTTATGIATSGAFKGLKTPRDILRYNLMRGVTDFSNLEQWDFYEKGYPFLVVIKAPDFMMDLAFIVLYLVLLAKVDARSEMVLVVQVIQFMENTHLMDLKTI